jgi:hypothetical protein
MQLYRLQKSKLPTTLFGKNYDSSKTIDAGKLDGLLKKQPFNFENDSERAKLVSYLLSNKSSSTAGQIASKFESQLGDWEVFNPDKEQTYDKEISQIVQDNLL